MRFRASHLTQFDEEIRSGRGHNVVKVLAKINLGGIPRASRLPLANICRRVGMFALGLKLLGQVIYPKRSVKRDLEATSGELAEYAVLLARSGIQKEALDLLARVDTRQTPEALLYRAFAHFERWDFTSAIPHLDQFLKESVSDYWKLVGWINLAYAYIGCERYDEALAILTKNIAVAKRGGFIVLQANCYELSTRLYAQTGNLAKAQDSLFEANRIIGSNQTNEQRLIKKWTAILKSMEAGNLEALQKYQHEINSRTNSEFLREVDRFSLRIEFDRSRFDRLIFGTAFAKYREMVYRETGKFPDKSELLIGDAKSPCMDVRTGKIDGSDVIETGGKCHALIEILMRDFYRSFRLGELHSELYPRECFDVFSSPNRVHQILHRTREWIATARLPLQIGEENGSYFLKFTGEFSFLVPLERGPVDGYHQHFAKLRSLIGPNQIFQAKEARNKLKIPRTTFFRFTVWAMGAGLLERIGEHNSVCYRILEPRSQMTATENVRRAA